jgi:hypothetical protein
MLGQHQINIAQVHYLAEYTPPVYGSLPPHLNIMKLQSDMSKQLSVMRGRSVHILTREGSLADVVCSDNALGFVDLWLVAS